MPNELLFRPTLLVGLGGTGCQIAESVVKRVRATGRDLEGRVQIVGFDTDENDMRRRQALEERQRVRFSSNFTVDELLDRFPEAEREWFVTPRKSIPMEIRKMTMLDGAAQVRMLTRLAMREAMDGGRIENAVGDAIARLGTYDNRAGASGQINVLIVGSLAGATGSGTFLQLALLINDIGDKRGPKTSVRGLFLMPDVYVRSGALPQGQIPNVLANGYASFKEFHAVYMMAAERAGRYDFRFDYAPGRRIAAGDMPYVSISTIDYEDMKGGNLGRGIDVYRRMAEHVAYIMLFTPVGSKADSVAVNDARKIIQVAGKGTHDRIAAIGLSVIEYPHAEIADYLGLQLAREVLAGDWLRLDQSFRAKLARFRDQRAAGNATISEPDIGASFLEDIKALAIDENRAFFRELWQELYPTARQQGQAENEAAPLHIRYLEALEAHVAKTYWNTEGLTDIGQRKSADIEQFAGEQALAETVRIHEFRLDDDWRRIGDSLATRPADILINLLSTADDSGEADWRDHHLQTYLVKGGPHLVRNRTFLYALRRLVAERLQALKPEDQRMTLFRLANAFDPDRGREPAERGSPKILEDVSDVGRRGMIGQMLKGKRKDWVEQYVGYYNGSIRNMKAFAEQRLKQRVYEILLQEIDEQLRVLGGLFLEIESALERLAGAIRDGERLHQRGVFSGNVIHVCADAQCKQAFWHELRDAAAGQRLAPEASRSLALAAYAKARRQRRARKPESLEDLRDLFWRTVIDGFAKKKVTEDFRAIHAMSVMGAIEKECTIEGGDARSRLEEYVRVAETQSEPLVTLTDPTAGQFVRYWAIHPKLRDEMQALVNVDQLLSAGLQGVQPVQEPEFLMTELLCVSQRVGLELAHLAKLSPAVRHDGSVAAERSGRYFDEYQRMVDEIVAAAGENRIAATFTPHVHRDWHKPGVLPEIAEGVTRRLVSEVNRAFMAAIVTGALLLETSHGEEIAEISTANKVPAGSVSVELLRGSHDIYEVLRAFERRPDAARACLAAWRHALKLLGRAAAPGAPQPALLGTLESGAAIERVLPIAGIGSDEEMRKGRVRDLIAGHAELMTEAVAAARPDLPERGRLIEADRLSTAAHEAVLGKLKSQMMRETYKTVETCATEGLERWRKDSGLLG